MNTHLKETAMNTNDNRPVVHFVVGLLLAGGLLALAVLGLLGLARI